MPELYERIEELCRKKGINITQMCTDCGIPRASMTDYKKGRKKTLSADTLSKIAEYFKISVDYLYGGEPSVSGEESAKIALFGGDSVVTDEMWDEVKRYARYLKEKSNGT